ncbi:hypothetical protein [Acidianus sp. HS-5]|uniref:hypothetical protein n=1 Tax=Acidianus sp. HS-5 TaxID=2886040 RepID=UPI001F3FF606|nr:hypothetical protein [Acidianus sp. HS-5]BDC18507.1 hypothetical protein HS5_13970 [Acidianus sp. HS-5]
MSKPNVTFGKDIIKHLEDIRNVTQRYVGKCKEALTDFNILQKIVDLCIIPIFRICDKSGVCINDDKSANKYFNEVARRTFYIRYCCCLLPCKVYFRITVALDNSCNYTVVTFHPITRIKDCNFEQKTKLKNHISIICCSPDPVSCPISELLLVFNNFCLHTLHL